ncbi:MAG: hypothetical protein RR704_19805 [Stenotrophomonas sp.]
MTATPYRNYRFGIGISLLLASVIAALSLVAVCTPNLGWGVVALATLALWVGVPLLLLLVLAWARYMVRERGRLPGRVHAVLLLPTAAAVLIVPVGQALRSIVDTATGGSRAAIAETHINLSGNALWLDTSPYASTYSGAGPDLPMDWQVPEHFVAFHRYPNAQSDADTAFPYDNARLKPGIDQYRYGAPPGGSGTPLPLHRQPYPDTTALTRVWGTSGGPGIVHLYYHYADHVEVAPALARLAGATEYELERSRVEGLVQFKTHNYGTAPIVRLEIDGVALDIRDEAIAPIPPPPAACTASNHTTGVALLNLDRPLQVRWQTTADPQKWHRARVQVPAFRQPFLLDGQSTLLRVLLYVLPDGTLAAERYVEVSAGDARRGIRATGLPASAAAHATCGSAYAIYGEDAPTPLAD